MQVWSIVAAASAFATCPSRAHREPVFPPHNWQHTDGKTALRHVQELERWTDGVTVKLCTLYKHSLDGDTERLLPNNVSKTSATIDEQFGLAFWL